mmetsp:Transcript_38496/g.43944  ORF Transcript_38496/g.43944 Transcript_38496/m.43944 type:complete len:184 (+) Transcript_38496:38-589(+)
MSLKQRLSTIDQIVTKSKKQRKFKGEDWSYSKRRRIITESSLVPSYPVWRTNTREISTKALKKKSPLPPLEEVKKLNGTMKREIITGNDSDFSTQQVELSKIVENASMNDATCIADDIVKGFATQLKAITQSIENDIEEVEEKKIATQEKQFLIWKTYLSGLEEISILTDLRDAPDAIMPGNF